MRNFMVEMILLVVGLLVLAGGFVLVGPESPIADYDWVVKVGGLLLVVIGLVMTLIKRNRKDN